MVNKLPKMAIEMILSFAIFSRIYGNTLNTHFKPNFQPFSTDFVPTYILRHVSHFFSIYHFCHSYTDFAPASENNEILGFSLTSPPITDEYM